MTGFNQTKYDCGCVINKSVYTEEILGVGVCAEHFTKVFKAPKVTIANRIITLQKELHKSGPKEVKITQ